MRIKNNTLYDTLELKRHVRLVMDKVGVRPKGYVVYVDYRRKNARILGKASYYSKWIKLFLLRKENLVKQLLSTIEHELHHNLGVRHGDMSYGYVRDWGGFDGQKIYEKPPLVKPKKDLRLGRFEQASKKVKFFRTKLKRTSTLLKKWECKVKYYEKVFSS